MYPLISDTFPTFRGFLIFFMHKNISKNNKDRFSATFELFVG